MVRSSMHALAFPPLLLASLLTKPALSLILLWSWTKTVHSFEKMANSRSAIKVAMRSLSTLFLHLLILHWKVPTAAATTSCQMCAECENPCLPAPPKPLPPPPPPVIESPPPPVPIPIGPDCPPPPLPPCHESCDVPQRPPINNVPQLPPPINVPVLPPRDTPPGLYSPFPWPFPYNSPPPPQHEDENFNPTLHPAVSLNLLFLIFLFFF